MWTDSLSLSPETQAHLQALPHRHLPAGTALFHAGDRAQGNEVQATQAEIAARIGSAREVVSRHLHMLAEAGVLRTERGHVLILDAKALHQRARGLV